MGENKKINPEYRSLNYVSDNNHINDFFLVLDNKHPESMKKYENAIKKECDNDSDKIKELTSKLSKLNPEVLNDIYEAKNLSLFAEYGNELYSRFEESEAYGFGLYDIYRALNENTKEVLGDLLSIENMDLRTLIHSLQYCDSIQKAKELKSLIADVKTGKKNILELPYVPKAEINKDILSLKGTKTRSFADGTDMSEVLKQTKQGEAVFVGNKTYVNDKGEMTELQMDKAMFEKLFPPFESQIMQQGNKTGDCMFLANDIMAFMRNDNARPELYKLFKQDGDDIVVTLPAYPDNPVRFKNGLPDECQDEWHVTNTSLGNRILEQAFVKAAFAHSTFKQDASSLKFKGLMRELPNEVSFCDKIRTGERKSVRYHEKEMVPYLEKIANDDSKLITARTFWHFNDEDHYDSNEYDFIADHAYVVSKVDTKQKKVTLVNPFNSLYTTEVSFDKFKKYFDNIHVTDLNK